MATRIALFIIYVLGIMAMVKGLDYVLSPDNFLKSESIFSKLGADPTVYFSTLIAYFIFIAFVQFKYFKAGYKII